VYVESAFNEVNCTVYVPSVDVSAKPAAVTFVVAPAEFVTGNVKSFADKPDIGLDGDDLSFTTIVHV